MPFPTSLVRRAVLVSAPLLAFALALAGGCSPAGPGKPPDGDPDGGDSHPQGLCQNTPRPTYTDVWGSVLKGCATSGCHADGAGGLRFTNQDEFLAATIRRPSNEIPGASRVVPGIPAESYLYQKLLDGAAQRMPLNGPYLDADKQALVAGWICGGAVDDRNEGGHHDEDGGDMRFPDGGGDVRGPDGGVEYPNPDGGGDEHDPDGGRQPFDAGMPMGGPDGGFEEPGDGGGGASSDPWINGFDPLSGFVGSRVSIHGMHFGTDVRDIVVTFTNHAQAPIESATDTDLAVLVPDGAQSGPISVTVRGITATSGDSFDVIIPNPVPVLTSLSPASATVGSGELTLTLSGSGFVQASQALLDGNQLATTFVNATTLTVVVPAANFARGGLHVVAVQNPGPGGGFSAAQSFPVENPVPAIARLTPAKVLAPSPDLTVGIDGTGFNADTQIQVNGTLVSSVGASATHIDATFPSALLQVAATLAVTAFNPGPGGGTSDAVTFSVENPPPNAVRLSPISLEVGTTTRNIAVLGSNFVALSRIQLDGVALATTFTSTTRLDATVDAAVVQEAGSHQVTVKTPAPGGGTTPPMTLTVTNPAPALTGIDPASGPTGSTNIFVRLSGSRFTAASVVRVNGVDAPATNVLDAGAIIANLPNTATPGDVQVTVFTPGPGGGTSAPLVFTYVDSGRPTITGLSPSRPASGADFTLTITGTNFGCVGSGTGAVSFNGIALTPSQCSTTQVTVLVPATAAGTYPVRVTNQSTDVTSDAANLTVFDPRPVPVLTDLSPTLAGSSSQPLTVTLTGVNFAPDATVAAGSTSLNATITDAAHATAVVPASLLASPGTLSLTVFNPGPGGGTSNAKTLQVVTPNPVPAIGSVSPARIDQGATNIVLHLTGTGFVAASSVTWDTFARTVTYLDATHLDVALLDSDAAQPGTHALVVSNPEPGGGSSSAFTMTVVALNPEPALSGLSVTSTRAGGSSMSLTLDGSAFVANSTVNFNGSPRTTTFVSSTRLTTTLSSADLAIAGNYAITVVNPAPGGGTSNALTFTVANPIATIDTLSPASVSAGGAAFTLAVSGSLFTQTSVVRIAGVDRTTHFVSASQLTVDVPGSDIANAGTPAVTVFNPAPGGGVSNAVSLTVTNPTPVITGLSPCGAVAGGASNLIITVTGSGFVPGMSATFNGSPFAMAVTNANTATITVSPAAYATAPASRTVPVVLTTPAPGGSSTPKDFGLASRAVNYLTEIQQNIFNARCTGCHGGSGGLFLTGDARTALVGVSAPEVPSISLVEACAPTKEHSFLIDKVSSSTPAAGGQMPQGGPFLSTGEVDTLRDWIAAGAK